MNKSSTSDWVVALAITVNMLLLCLTMYHLRDAQDRLAALEAAPVTGISREARAADLYPTVPIATIAAGKRDRPRATVTGVVKEVRDEEDGDKHVVLTDGKDFVVCEVIPELKFAPPKVGDTVTAWGIVRRDGEHDWWELHPLIGWRKKTE